MIGWLRACRASKLLASFGALPLLFATPAAAQEVRAVSLSWSLAPNAAACITASELWTSLERRLSFALQATDDGLSIEGRMSKRADGRGFEATVTFAADKAHTRTLFARGDDCHALDQALLLVLAVAIEALAPPAAAAPQPRSAAVGGVAVSAGQRVAEGPRESAHPADARPTQADANRPREDAIRVNDANTAAALQVAPAISEPSQQTLSGVGAARVDAEHPWQLGAGLRVAFGLMPGPTTGAQLALSRSWSRALAFELDVTLWPLGRQPTSAGDARFGAAALDALVCPQLFAEAPVQNLRMCRARPRRLARARGVGRPVAGHARATPGSRECAAANRRDPGDAGRAVSARSERLGPGAHTRKLPSAGRRRPSGPLASR